MFSTEDTQLANRDMKDAQHHRGDADRHRGQVSPRTCQHGHRQKDENERAWARTPGDCKLAQPLQETGGGGPPRFKNKASNQISG